MSDDDWFAELEALQLDSRQLQSDSEELQRDLAGILTIGEHGAVTVVLDAQGLIADVAIDDELREEIEPFELVEEINLAIMRAVGSFGTRDQPRWATELDAPANAAAITPLIGQLLSTLSTGITAEPREFSSDMRNVTVTALFGAIVSVSCDLAWLAVASASSIGEEVVRMARLASIETDLFGRFAKSGVHDDR
jgi:DNA-binding protein YbaB